MVAKTGANENHRLGHHSSGKGSLEVYSRDLLTAPLRTLEEILRQIGVVPFNQTGIVGEPTNKTDRQKKSPSNSSSHPTLSSKEQRERKNQSKREVAGRMSKELIGTHLLAVQHELRLQRCIGRQMQPWTPFAQSLEAT